VFRRFVLRVGVLFIALIAAWCAFLYWQSRQPQESVYDPIIANVARNEGVDPFLVRALIWRESKFEPLTHGQADEHGLMQVTPDVGAMWAKANKVEDYTSESLYNAETNIRAGTWYLERALKHWEQTDDPVTFALAEYNAGRKNAQKWVDPLSPQSHVAFMDRITFPSTRKYVEVILAKRDQYRHALAHDRWYQADPETASNEITAAATNSPSAAASDIVPAPTNTP
jgi:soluble lytic murein transglycosylase